MCISLKVHSSLVPFLVVNQNMQGVETTVHWLHVGFYIRIQRAAAWIVRVNLDGKFVFKSYEFEPVTSLLAPTWNYTQYISQYIILSYIKWYWKALRTSPTPFPKKKIGAENIYRRDGWVAVICTFPRLQIHLNIIMTCLQHCAIVVRFLIEISSLQLYKRNR